ncbi:MAG: hypothetical protein ACYTBJ_17345 [Planctomycetota bacterium]|jgi:hypothetical protein
MRSGPGTKWLLPVLVILGAAGLLFVAGSIGSRANAQVEMPSVGDGRILAVPVQIDRDSYGIAMIDTVAQTLWVYELNSRGPAHKRLRLLAARSWRYDRLLEQYNTDEPTPEQVKLLMSNLGRKSETPNMPKKTDTDRSILRMAEPEARDVNLRR